MLGRRSGSSVAERRADPERSRFESGPQPTCPSGPTGRGVGFRCRRFPVRIRGGVQRGMARQPEATPRKVGVTPRHHISTAMRHTMHGFRKEYLGNRVPQRFEFDGRRDGECSPSRRRYAAPTPSRERGSPAGCEGTPVRARQARAVPMTSESGGRIGARTRAQRLGGQARGCEAFCGSKGHGTSRESTSSVNKH